MHDDSSKDTSSNTNSLKRQLIYRDSLSNATLSLLLISYDILVDNFKCSITVPNNDAIDVSSHSVNQVVLVCVDALRPSQYFFSVISGHSCLPG